MSRERSQVTVLLPTISVDDWVRAAVESVWRDDESVEVLVLLDGFAAAPDLDWLRRDRIRAVPLHPRRGIVAALNTGLGLVETKYAARMDGDDVSLPGRLSAQRAFLDSNPDVVAVGTQAAVIDEAGRTIGEMRVPTGPAAVARRLLQRNALIHPTVMFRAEEVRRAGGYAATVHDAEDYELFLRLALSHQLANLPTVYLEYRRHDGQVTAGFDAFSPDKRVLRAARRELARHLGFPQWMQVIREVAWVSVQVARRALTRIRRRNVK